MAFFETKVYDDNNILIGYTEYNNIVDAFTIPIFETKEQLNMWWTDKKSFNQDDCLEQKNVYLECTHGRVKRIAEWNKEKGHGYIKKQFEVYSKEWIKS